MANWQEASKQKAHHRHAFHHLENALRVDAAATAYPDGANSCQVYGVDKAPFHSEDAAEITEHLQANGIDPDDGWR
jgi:hypothetical protein